jgi:ABC-type phosphate/phosphonate transport system substrate-binding protein
MTSTYRALVEVLGRRIGQPAQLLDGTSLDQLRHGLVDAAVVCGLPYIQLQAESPDTLRPLAAPVLQEEPSGRPVYFSEVIVRAGTEYRHFGDLRGARWAHTDAGSFSGYIATRYELVLMGESEAFFGQVLYAGSHRGAIRMVLDGQADAAAIDSHVLSVERQGDADVHRLRVIARFGPAPAPPIVATRRLPFALGSRICDILCALDAGDPAYAFLKAGRIRRFLPVSDGDYDDIRGKLDAVERSGAPV